MINNEINGIGLLKRMLEKDCILFDFSREKEDSSVNEIFIPGYYEWNEDGYGVHVLCEYQPTCGFISMPECIGCKEKLMHIWRRTDKVKDERPIRNLTAEEAYRLIKEAM